MANPEYKEKLDGLDKISVCAYRLGISIFAFALLAQAAGINGITEPFVSTIMLVVATALTAANLHIYDKKVRAIIVWCAWLGLVLMVTMPNIVWLPLGFIYVTFSGVVLKESFCFRVPGLKFVPMLLAVNIVLLFFNLMALMSILLLLTGMIVVFLAIQKWRMPLHFDIGIKANYQI